MTLVPDTAMLAQVIDATWPAAVKEDHAGVTIRDGRGGGSRVSAATANRAVSADQLPALEAAMQALGQPRLFMIGADNTDLDALLANHGYVIKDTTLLFSAPLTPLLETPVPPVTSFQVWPMLACQREIWAAGGIGPARIAIMERATCPKSTFLGRINDAPAGTVYAGCHGTHAMLHALEITPAARRMGLAANLTRGVARWAATQGATTLSLATTQANSGARALYSSLGMTVVGQYHYRIKPDELP